MKHQICRIVLAAAAVTAGVFLSACGLFLDTSDSVFDDAEDAIATGSHPISKARSSHTNSEMKRSP